MDPLAVSSVREVRAYFTGKRIGRNWTSSGRPRRLKAVVAPADPALRAKAQPAAASPPDRRLLAGPAIVSRFGEISPAFAAAFGASVDVGLSLGARNAQARAFSGAARYSHTASPGPALPVEIPTVRTVPPSRVRTAIVTEPSR